MDQEVNLLTNTELGEFCAENNEAYKQNKELSDERFCLELLRRAVFKIDGAINVVFNIYRELLQQKIKAILHDDDVVDDLVQETFIRFFTYVTPESWSKFKTLPHILAYMNRCSEAVTYNYLRENQTQERYLRLFKEYEESLTKGRNRRVLERQYEYEQFHTLVWQCIKRNCLDSLDLFLAQQLWEYGLQPKEVVKRYSEKFPKPIDVYKRKRNLIDRIKRDNSFYTLSKSRINF